MCLVYLPHYLTINCLLIQVIKTHQPELLKSFPIILYPPPNFFQQVASAFLPTVISFLPFAFSSDLGPPSSAIHLDNTPGPSPSPSADQAF
jgi:hypothetical protein